MFYIKPLPPQLEAKILVDNNQIDPAYSTIPPSSPHPWEQSTILPVTLSNQHNDE